MTVSHLKVGIPSEADADAFFIVLCFAYEGVGRRSRRLFPYFSTGKFFDC